MKKIIASIVFIVTLLFLINNISSATNQELYNQHCLGITGKFTARNWTGGEVEVGCDGDAGRYCIGEIKTVRPNKEFILNRCSCPPYADGCLKIGKNLRLVKNSAGRPRIQVVQRIPNSCDLNYNRNKCGTNGNTITNNFSIVCDIPETPTSTPTNTPTPTASPTPTPTLTPTPTPTQCPTPDTVANVRIICPNCSNSSNSSQ